ncbi:MAG TPA: glycosyltransferase family 1 protein [Vicinamibacteria bacterium]|jgi:glycosyltransferase involved in cell wall biosynthesis
MRIGVDGRELQGRPTGAGRYLRNLIRLWTAGGEDRLLVYFNGPPPADAVLDHPAVARRAVGDRPVRGLAWQEGRLPAAARGDGLDVFFAPAYSCPLSLDVPRVTAVHDVSFFSMPQDFSAWDAWRRRALLRATARVSRAVLACSEFTRREILSWLPALAGRVHHVPLAAADDLPAPPARAEARRSLAVRGEYVITVGSIFNRRRLPDLLRAVAALSRRRREVVLDVAGENRTHPPLDLDAQLHELDLGDRVRLSGYVSDAELVMRYAAADVAVFLSEYEGFGLGALEAMAHGVPTIVAARPSLDEVTGDGALRVDPEDVPGIAAALDRVLGDAALRAELAAKGRARAGQFAWGETARRTRAVLAAAAR